MNMAGKYEIISTMQRFQAAATDAERAATSLLRIMQKQPGIWRLYLRSMPYSQFRRARMR